MIKNNSFTGLWLVFVGLTGSAFAQLNGTYTPSLDIDIPVFDGVVLEDSVSTTSFSLTMVQTLTSSKLTGTGEVSASEFTSPDETLVVDFAGSLSFSATATKTGQIVRLTGAKATLGKDVTGSGMYTEGTDSYGVTVSSVTGSYGFKTLSVDLFDQQIAGQIAPGSIKVAGFITDDPSQRGTVKVGFGAEDFGPYDFPAENIINPDFSLDLITSSRNAVTGSAIGTFGDYDDVSFSVKGKRNAKTGVSTLTLASRLKGISATLNLDDDGEISGTNNALNVLGYKLKF